MPRAVVGLLLTAGVAVMVAAAVLSADLWWTSVGPEPGPIFGRQGFRERAGLLAAVSAALALQLLFLSRVPRARLVLLVPVTTTLVIGGLAAYDALRWRHFAAEGDALARTLGVTWEDRRGLGFPSGMYARRLPPGTRRAEVEATVLGAVTRLTCLEGRAEKYVFYEIGNDVALTPVYRDALNVRYTPAGTVERAYVPDSADDLDLRQTDPRYRCIPSDNVSVDPP